MEEVKEKVINEFLNTRKHIKNIARENNLSIEEIYDILEEYNKDERIKRSGNDNTTFLPKKTVEESYEKIYQLRKQQKSYSVISKEIGISTTSIRIICKEVFKEKGEKEPKCLRKATRTEEIAKKYERIYQLRKQKKTYKDISEETGLSIDTVYSICKKIFDEKGEKEPKSSRKDKRSEQSKKTDEMIYNLVQQGRTYGEISESLNTIGISMSNERIRQRYKRKVLQNQKDLAKMILNLTITRKATIEQIQQIADYYGVDLEETMNSLEER